MNKLVIITVDNQSQADQVHDALRGLHSRHEIILHDHAVVTTNENGEVALSNLDDREPVGTAVGAAIGALIGALAGPAGAFAGATIGGVAGACRDLYGQHIDTEFLTGAVAALESGKCAVVAAVDEGWTMPLDTLVAEIGGRITRKDRAEFEAAKLEEASTAVDISLTELEENFQELTEEINEAWANDADEARGRAEEFKSGLKVKLGEARNKVSAESEQRRAELEEELADINADYERRADKLVKASRLAAEAFQSIG